MADPRKRFVTHTSKNVDCPLRQNPRALISGLAPSAVLFPIMSAEELGLLIDINAGPSTGHDEYEQTRLFYDSNEQMKGGDCLRSTVISEPTLETKWDKFSYIGLTEGTFKSRYYGHTNSFSQEK